MNDVIQIRDCRTAFGRVERSVMIDPKISYQAKALYGVLCAYAGAADDAYPTQATLSENLGVSDRSIRNWTTELKNLGIIAIRKKKMKSGLYRNIYDLLDYSVHYRKQDSGGTGNELPVVPETGFREKRTVKEKKEREHSQQQVAEDYKQKSSALLDTWNELFLKEMGRPYRPLPADFKQIKNAKLFEIFTVDRIKELVRAWFASPAKFQPRAIKNFATGYHRVEKPVQNKPQSTGNYW